MKAQTMIRAARWGALLAAAPLIWACNDRSLFAPEGEPEQEIDHYFEQNVNNEIDLVFLIDNSSSMDQEQANITRNFPTFMNVLKSLPAGLPDVHIGVVSSSLGAGAFTDINACAPGGDRGAFQKTPRGKNGACTAVPTGNYIISFKKGTENNFTGDIADVFSCIAELGTGGCGFEHQLGAVARALGANLGGWKNGAPPENQGFLRDDAYLGLIFLTDEDDCSAPIDSDLFDTKQMSVSDPLGPLNSYRCNEFGHLCGGVKPPRSPASNLQDCHSAEGAGKLIAVSEFVSFFKAVKKIPNRVITAAIAAPPAPYSVAEDGMMRPKVVPSCTSMNGSADPGVRMKEFIDAFGMNGTFASICSDQFNSAMERIAMEIGKRLGKQCLDGVLRDKDPERDGVQPDCQVVDLTFGAAARPLANCNDGGTPPCWTLNQNPMECTASGYELKIDRGGQMAPPATQTSVKCATCTKPGDPACKTM